MLAIKVIKLVLYPVQSLLGTGVGNVRFLKWLFAHFINLMPDRYILLETNGCKLGMTVGRSRGFDSMASSLLLGKGYEIGTTSVFRKLVKPDMKVVDVGAHIGYYTVLASSLVGDKGKVWAFEPEPRNYQELLKNIEINRSGNVIPVRKAIGEAGRESSLYYSNKWSGECSLVQIRQRPKDCLPVDVVALDDVFEDEVVDVMKVDVEGGEMMVLEGAKKVIQRSSKIKLLIECLHIGMEAAGDSCKKYWDTFESCGFTHIYVIESKSGVLIPVSLDSLRMHIQCSGGANLLCTKERI